MIAALHSPPGRAAQRATATIPIVVTVMGDPVGDGFALSLARRRRTVTGPAFLGGELVAERLALPKELVPKATRIVLLGHPAGKTQGTADEMTRDTEPAAKSRGVGVPQSAMQHPTEIDACSRDGPRARRRFAGHAESDAGRRAEKDRRREHPA